MIKIGLVSDTHHSEKYMNLTIKKLKQHRIDECWHLGDHYDDADTFIRAGFKLIRVPGTWSTHYRDNDVNNRLYLEKCDWKFFLTHAPEPHHNDLRGDENPLSILNEKRTDIFCYGHTHIPSIHIENGVCCINPGHLFDRDNRGAEPTYAVLEIDTDVVKMTIYSLLSDAVIQSEKITEKVSRRHGA